MVRQGEPAGPHLGRPRELLCHDRIRLHAFAPLVHHEASVEVHIAHVGGRLPQDVGALLLVLPDIIQVLPHPLILPFHDAGVTVLPVSYTVRFEAITIHPDATQGAKTADRQISNRRAGRQAGRQAGGQAMCAVVSTQARPGVGKR